jgi:Calcineurin-like phosphoesterase
VIVPERIRIGLMSDIHLDVEEAWWERHIIDGARRGDSSTIARALQLRRELQAEPGHPDRGPDLRGLKSAGVDLLLLPGDIDSGVSGIRYAAAAAGYLGVGAIVCAGNHEAYGYDLVELTRELRAEAASTDGAVRFLEMERSEFVVRTCRVAVLGATMWTDYQVTGDARRAMAVAEDSLNDHLLIRYGGRPFRPEEALEIHRVTCEWLAREVPRARAEADIVIIMTHHAPIAAANPPEHRGGSLSPAFVSDMRTEILAWEPDLWVWGHTHHTVQATIGRTLLVSSQRGYVGIELRAQTFVPAVIEIGAGTSKRGRAG